MNNLTFITNLGMKIIFKLWFRSHYCIDIFLLYLYYYPKSRRFL